MTLTFEEIKVRGSKTVKCDGCGKPLKRSRTFSQTVSPFNKNADGSIKSRSEIYTELCADRVKWRKAPETCKACS